jgi:hypothetical protein
MPVEIETSVRAKVEVIVADVGESEFRRGVAAMTGFDTDALSLDDVVAVYVLPESSTCINTATRQSSWRASNAAAGRQRSRLTARCVESENRPCEKSASGWRASVITSNVGMPSWPSTCRPSSRAVRSANLRR